MTYEIQRVTTEGDLDRTARLAHRLGSADGYRCAPYERARAGAEEIAT